MTLFGLLGTAWTVWKVTAKRLGPVGGLFVTAAVIGGLLYLRPWLSEHAPGIAKLVGTE